MAKVSVIVPVYNVERYLERGLSSLINQTLKDLEIIIINDGSTDKSLEICRHFEKVDSRIKLINKENEGVSIARNVGIQYASSDYIVFFDPDDELCCDMYEELYADIIKSKCDLILCNYIEVSNCEKRINLPYSKGVYGRGIIDSLLLNLVAPERVGEYSIMGSPWRGIYSRRIINEYNIKFPEHIRPMEDLIFNLRYLMECSSVGINDKYLYRYYSEIGGGVRGYKSNYYDNGKKVMGLIEETLVKMEDTEGLKARLEIRWFIFLLNTIEMIMYSSVQLSYVEKRVILKSILGDPETKSYIRGLETQYFPIKIKFLYLGIKNRLYFLLMSYYEVVKILNKIR